MVDCKTIDSMAMVRWSKTIEKHWYQWFKLEKIIDNNGWIVKILQKTIGYNGANGFFSKTIDHSITLKKTPSLWFIWVSPKYIELKMKETKQNLLSKPSKQILKIFKNLEWDTNTALKQCHVFNSCIHFFWNKYLLGQVYNGLQNTRLHHAIIDQMERYTNPHLIKTSPQAKRHKSSLHVTSLHFFSLLCLF